jgi:hypothetical protein
VRASAELLAPGARVRSAEQRQKIEQDAVELIGDALYENNVPQRTREVLARRELAAHAPAIGLRTLTRYSANGVFAEAADLGERLVADYPLSAEVADLMVATADAYQKLGKTPKRLATLEKLALMLPAQSLWRARHRDDLALVGKMEERATKAAELVAAARYDDGLASGEPNSFNQAGAMYDLLLEYRANGAGANEWRLRKAHCLYFAGELAEAAKAYRALKTDYKVEPDVLEVASYQLVLTDERRWRDAFAAAHDRGENPLVEAKTLAAVQDLERSIDEFAARFPAQSRAVDLLLVGASVNRDMERLPEATRYWQRTLVSQPSPAQRGLAIRGIVYAATKAGSSGDVVEAARRFLKLEDWRALGGNLASELKGVLSVATLDEGQRLNASGRVRDAGALMTQIAAEFPDVPNRDRIYRDGAYMLAISGDWAAAQKAGEKYFEAGLVKNRADMTYLLARAHEYQLRLGAAATKYLELGEKYPSHPRAETSLTRAESLALADGHYETAAAAAIALAERAKREPERIAALTRGAEHLEKADDRVKALSVAQRRLRASRAPGERLKARAQIARLTYAAGSEQEALDDLAILAKDVERQRASLSPEDYAAVGAEVHYLLGEEARRKFEDFRILERGGPVAANVAVKSKIFETLVTEYDRSAQAGDPRWASEARYRLGTAAEAFATELAAVPAKTGEALSQRDKSRYQATVERLKDVARRYHGKNVLVARREPSRYRGDEWVKKSSLRLSGEHSDNPAGKHEGRLPEATQALLPAAWSL